MNILVPTDFSEFARSALDIACDLAPKLRAEVHLIHIIDSTETPPYTIDPGTNLDIEIQAARKKELNLLRTRAREREVEVIVHLATGDLLKELEKLIEEIDIDLVIAGAYGQGGIKQWTWGSLVHKIVRKIRKNILIIKNRDQPLSFGEVVFASSLDLQEQTVFKHFLRFLSHFEIKKLHILAIDTPGWFSQPTPVMTEALHEFRKLAPNYNCETHYFSDQSIDKGILKFSEQQQVDLIAISNRHRNPIRRIFSTSTIEALVNQSDLPIMSINSTNGHF